MNKNLTIFILSVFWLQATTIPVLAADKQLLQKELMTQAKAELINYPVSELYEREIIEAAAGNIVNISMEENPTTGYSWQCKIENPQTLELISDNYVENEHPKAMVGVGGVHNWEFKGLKEGSSKVIFEYSRPWESKVPLDKKEFTINVLAADDLAHKVEFSDYEKLGSSIDDEAISKWLNENKKEQGIYYQNFNDSDYILISAGQCPTAGYSVELEQLYTNPDKNILYVDWKLDAPSANQMTAQVLTYPHAIVELKSSKAFDQVVDIKRKETVAKDEVTKALNVTLNNKSIKLPVDAIIENDSIMVPVRVIAESAGAGVEWVEASRTVVISKDNLSWSFKAGEDTAIVDGVKTQIGSNAVIVNGHSMLPISFLAERLGLNYEWKVNDSNLILYKANL